MQKIKENSLFLINKLNLYSKTERDIILKKIIQETPKEFNLNLILEQNCFIINAKAKNLEVNKYTSFLNYTEYIINKEDLEENTEIIDLLTDSFKKDFNFTIPPNIDYISKKSKKSNGYNEYLELISNYNILRGNFKESHFFYFNEKYEEILNKNKNKIKTLDKDGFIIKNAIKNKIRDSIDKLLDEKYFRDILDDLKISEKELNEDFIKFVNIENPLNIIHVLDYPIKELKKIGYSNEGVTRLYNDHEDLTNFLENNIFIHYIILGIFSSGKSFTLNNMIGYNLYMLETGRAETTNHAFIIRYSKHINLFNALLEKTKYGYYFKKTEKIASGKDEVIDKIKYVNHNIQDFSYFILETPILEKPL